MEVNESGLYDPKEITAIGISYQMRGLVLVDRNQNLLRDAILGCDLRATDPVKYPYGSFTAGKLAWVKEHEPKIYQRIDKILLPGDYIAMKLTGEMTTTPSALSEGLFWDFKTEWISSRVFYLNDFDKQLIPSVIKVFDIHGYLKDSMVRKFGFAKAVQVSYKAGEQLNNALSVNVFHPGEVAIIAGGSGVIYSVTDKHFAHSESRVDVFAHVNHGHDNKRLGVCLGLKGCGNSYQWIKNNFAQNLSYAQMNEGAASVLPGSEGIQFFPFGNGTETMLENNATPACIKGFDFNRHKNDHLFRAVLEGVAYSFRYGLDVMKENRIRLKIIRAPYTGLFLSKAFTRALSDITHLPVELYDTDGPYGAAIGAGIGAHILTKESAFKNYGSVRRTEPGNQIVYEEYYQRWKNSLNALS